MVRSAIYLGISRNCPSGRMVDRRFARLPERRQRHPYWERLVRSISLFNARTGAVIRQEVLFVKSSLRRKRLLTTTCAAGQRWCRSVSSEISGLLRAGCPVPWQQIGDAPGRIIRDSGDDVAEIGFGGKSV